jgi:hypothetical protein
VECKKKNPSFIILRYMMRYGVCSWIEVTAVNSSTGLMHTQLDWKHRVKLDNRPMDNERRESLWLSDLTCSVLKKLMSVWSASKSPLKRECAGIQWGCHWIPTLYTDHDGFHKTDCNWKSIHRQLLPMDQPSLKVKEIPGRLN